MCVLRNITNRETSEHESNMLAVKSNAVYTLRLYTRKRNAGTRVINTGDASRKVRRVST